MLLICCQLITSFVVEPQTKVCDSCAPSSTSLLLEARSSIGEDEGQEGRSNPAHGLRGSGLFPALSPKTLVPARPRGQTGTKWGVGVRQALFPMPALGACSAAGFPTLFSTASGVSGLIAGPSSALRSLNCRVRPLSPLGLVVAPPVCGPGKDTFVTCAPRLYRLLRVGHGFWPRVGPVPRV